MCHSPFGPGRKKPQGLMGAGFQECDGKYVTALRGKSLTFAVFNK